MNPQQLRVLCAGDKFIGSSALAEGALRVIGDGVQVTEYQTEWPDQPFGPVEGVTEASGDPAEVAALAADVDVIMTHLAPVTGGVLAAARRLRVVGVTRGGPVNVDLEAATQHGVPVVYLPGRNLEAVAEYTVGLIIALTRNIVDAAAELRAGSWDARYFRYELTGPELRAATVGLVGLGAVGRRVGEIVGAVGGRVLGFDPHLDPGSLKGTGIEVASMPTLLAEADVVSLHARTPSGSGPLFDRDVLAQMKPGSYLVNTARGALVDEAALAEALERGHLRGAALDVFDPEPPELGRGLVLRPDVIATPHLAGSSRQVALESVQRVATEVAEYLVNGKLEHCANPDWSAHRGDRP